ncbi:MAG: hypothetical protein FJY74_06905 [Candidatus Eisenbacteria bacterium]|nr:hypothetical protein [Candidatus Eisenbacteria bacterium]
MPKTQSASDNMTAADPSPRRARVGLPQAARDLAAFAGVVAWAAVERWQARDVVWGLWISSLVVGYCIIVLSIVRAVRRHSSTAPRWVSVAGGVALLAFFTVHFGGFHFVHGIFLNALFPLVGEEGRLASPAVMAGAALWSFWPLVLASLVSRLADFRRASEVEGFDRGVGAAYGSVVRMHLLIFVFVGLHFAGLGGLAVYVALAAYFFPWGAVRGASSDGSQTTLTSPHVPMTRVS